MDNLSFISRYEAILKERRIPKMAFYKRCGISDAAVSQWRKGKTSPATKTVDRIADFLGTSTEYLLTGVGPVRDPSKKQTFYTYGMTEDVVEIVKIALAQEEQEKEKPTLSGEQISEARKQLYAALDDMTDEELLFLMSKIKAIKNLRG